MTTTKTDSISKLAAALEAHARAKVARPEDNPFHEHALKDMGAAGLRSMQDKMPALNMAAKAPDSPAAYEMEVARFELEKEVKADKSAKRMATARARAARKVQFDEIANSPVRPDVARMRQAWLIVALMLPTITKIANGKRRWAARFLGDVTDDVASMVMENMAMMLAKSDRDLEVLEVAARQIGEQVDRTNQIPGDQLTEDERKERRQIAKARKWLMQVVNNRLMDTLVDVYCRSHNLRWDNIDVIATVMASINGPGEDPMTSRFKADRAPAFLGTRFQRPGGVDANLLATAINAAITEKGLDRMVELLLHTNTNGSFPWSERAEEVFMADPHGDGPWLWDMVTRSTEGTNRDGKGWTMDRARKARGDAARKYARSCFEWLPGFIMSVLDAFDPQMIGYAAPAPGGGRAILASEFELYYLPDEAKERLMLQPKLMYADAGEAARALIEHLALLTTGNDLVASAVNA